MDSEVICINEDDQGTRIQRSNSLNLNLEQEGYSPNLLDVSTRQSDSSSKGDSNTNGILNMEFISDQHAYKFYTKYASLAGFNVRKDWVNRSKVHGQVLSRRFSCSREGYRRKDKHDANMKKHRKETRTGCLAHMVVSRQPNGKYRITRFEENHNHEDINPISAEKLLELQADEFVEVTEATEERDANKEIESNLVYELLGRRFVSPHNFDCIPIDFDNYLKSGRTRDMKEGDAARLLYYFQRQHFENPSFFYATQLDIDDKVSNIYWADDNMVVDYDHFGDVVCLNTEYCTSKNFRPLVQFIGLNNHRQGVIFGAALLYDDTVDSYKWLFQTFIDSMSGKKPKAILTDQDAAIIQAIAVVLPETEHRVCAWQMYRNALHHLSPIIKEANSFAEDFRSCIFYHENEDDFNHSWGNLLEKFDLQRNEWLRWMFREKEKWAMAYGRNTFFSDSSGAHIIENLSVHLNDYLNPDIDVLQFFKHFENLVNDQRYKELEASVNMQRFSPRLMGNVIMLRHASEIYTPMAFQVFQREYEKSLNVIADLCSENLPLFEYKASLYGKPHEYALRFNSLDNTVRCSCMKFEIVGLLCCHGLKVLDHQNIKLLPRCFVLKRWTKDARTGTVTHTSSFALAENTKLVTASRYRMLCHNILKISSRAAESDRAFEFAQRQFAELIQGVEKLLEIKRAEETRATTSSSTGANATESEPPDKFLDQNALGNQNGDNSSERTNEIKNNNPEDSQLKDVTETISDLNDVQHAQSSATDTVVSISCQPTVYISSSVPLLGSLSQMQGAYSFEANQVVQGIYEPHNIALDERARFNMYSSQNCCSNPHNAPNHTQAVQAMDLDVQKLHSSPFR